MILSRGRLVCAAIVALALLTSPAAHAATTRGCPNAKSCSLYKLERYRWVTSRGVATIPFFVNPVQPWISQAEAVDAAVSAARTWSHSHTAIRFLSKGTTARHPVLGDSVNEVAWGRVPAGALAVANMRMVGGKVAEADVVLNILIPWAWQECAQRDGACGTASSDAGVLQRFDVQAVLTHEFGHWLGLAHLDQPGASELTMFATPNPGERKQTTLALGDLRGIRAAYPCRTCRIPRIVSP